MTINDLKVKWKAIAVPIMGQWWPVNREELINDLEKAGVIGMICHPEPFYITNVYCLSTSALLDILCKEIDLDFI